MVCRDKWRRLGAVSRLRTLVVRDRDVREALHRKVLKEHHGDADTLVLDELGLRHGTCRVDIAVVNGYLHGYEIKSAIACCRSGSPKGTTRCRRGACMASRAASRF
jgi:hypothetical protein